MRRALSFRVRAICSKSGDLIDVLGLFLGRSPVDFSLLNDEIQNALKKKEPLPDALYVLTYGPKGSKYAQMLTGAGKKAEVLLARGSSSTIKYLKDFSILNLQDGNFSRAHSISDVEYEIDQMKLLESGVASLVAETGAFQEAPTGHLFSHPSGRRTKYFLAASELLKNEVDAFFLGLCVVAKADVELRKASTLNIDTMGIYPIASAVQEIHTSSEGGESSLQLVSFHSHDGMKDFQQSAGGGEVVLISASTTGGMASAFVNEKAVPSDNVITLLDLTRSGRSGRTIYAHDEYAPIDTSSGSLVGTETSIELAGEYFAARGKRPKALTLSLEHRPANLKDLLDEFSASGICRLQHSRGVGSSEVDMVSFDQTAIAQSAKFQKWAADEVRLRTPSSVSHVLALGGPASVDVANYCAGVVQTVSGRSPLVVTEQTIGLLKSQNASGVLACSALVGNGHVLRIAARDLRELAPDASRHFLVGCSLSDTYESWTRLKQFLAQSGDPNRPYLFGCWRNLALGPKRPVDAWTRYAKLLQEMEHLPHSAGPEGAWTVSHIKACMELAMQVLDANRSDFLPNTAGGRLELTKGFVFWNPGRTKLDAASHSAASYLAMASALQFAREHRDSSIRLKSSLHETVLLDPENFLRFNDSVLQASLLRGANSFELDFSMSPDLSQAMHDLLDKVFSNHTSNYGAAALEFAVALAGKHLKLAPDDVVDLTLNILPKLGATPSALAGLLYVAWLRIPKVPRMSL